MFIGTTFLIFVMVYAVGDPVNAMFGERAPDPATAEQLREEFNLDKPIWQQYVLYMGNIFTGDFGNAFNGQPVTELMGTAFPITIRLAVLAIVFEILVGITLGVLTGLRRGRPIDSGVLMLTLVVISVPTFVTGSLAQYLLGVKWGWISPAVSPAAPARELLLPALVLALVSLAYVTRLTRTSIAENARADYVRTAVAKGLSRRRVTVRHLLRNSFDPRRHLPRDGRRQPDGRGAGHRADLQHPRSRLPAVAGHRPAELAHRRRLRDRPRHRLPPREPARRPPVRGA